jgi:hypothetical protein
MFDKIDMTATKVWRLVWSAPVWHTRGEVPWEIRSHISPHFFTGEADLVDYVSGHIAELEKACLTKSI